MKIVFLTDGIYPYVVGGMQRHSTNMIKHLVLSGVEVILFHAVNNGSKLPTEKEVNAYLFGDLNSFKIESAMKVIAGTARSMGITVSGKSPFEKNINNDK